jgi:hypothetical protein
MEFAGRSGWVRSSFSPPKRPPNPPAPRMRFASAFADDNGVSDKYRAEGCQRRVSPAEGCHRSSEEKIQVTHAKRLRSPKSGLRGRAGWVPSQNA